MVKIQKKRLIILCESSPTKVFSFVHEIQKWTHSSIFAFVELAASQHFLQATHNPLGYPDPVAKHVLTQRLPFLSSLLSTMSWGSEPLGKEIYLIPSRDPTFYFTLGCANYGACLGNLY